MSTWIICFQPVLSQANNFRLNEVMAAHYRPELADRDHQAAIFQGTDFGYGRKPL